MLDNTGCHHLCQLLRKISGLNKTKFPDFTFEQLLDNTKVENLTGTRVIDGTRTTNGLQVSYHTLKRIRYLQEEPEEKENPFKLVFIRKKCICYRNGSQQTQEVELPVEYRKNVGFNLQ